MIDLKAKNLFISVLELKIHAVAVDNNGYVEGVCDSLADVIEKTQAGLYDRLFFGKVEIGNPDCDENSGIQEDIKKWKAFEKEYDKHCAERHKYISSEEEYANSIEIRLVLANYLIGRLKGYEFANALIRMNIEQLYSAANLVMLGRTRKRPVPAPI